jgi:hypothetical protein
MIHHRDRENGELESLHAKHVNPEKWTLALDSIRW